MCVQSDNTARECKNSPIYDQIFVWFGFYAGALTGHLQRAPTASSRSQSHALVASSGGSGESTRRRFHVSVQATRTRT